MKADKGQEGKVGDVTSLRGSQGNRGWDEDQWFVGIQSWAGLTWHRITVLKELPKRSRVRFEEAAVGRPVGHEQNVPNRALKFGTRPQS